MNVEIMIVTHAKDIPFLRYCIASIEKFARRFSGVTLLVPRHQVEHFAWASSVASIKTFDEPEGKGMLAHEAQICRADEWCPNADAILHLDSDCMFWAVASPANYLIGDRPILYRERYADCWKSNPTRLLWQDAVERAIGHRPEWETMVRHPAIHLREVYQLTRALVEHHTKRPFDEFMLDGPNAFPQQIAEFPMLGAVAIGSYWDKYHFVDYDHDRDARECGVTKPFQYVYRAGRDFIVEVWSHGGIRGYSEMFDDIINGNPPPFCAK